MAIPEIAIKKWTKSSYFLTLTLIFTYDCDKQSPFTTSNTETSIKVCTLKNNTNLNPIFCLVKHLKIDFIFSPAIHLIIWVVILTKKFEKNAILKI